MDCFKCCHPVSSIRDYMIHLQMCVSPNETCYVCNYGDCVRKFYLKDSFRKHLISHNIFRSHGHVNNLVPHAHSSNNHIQLEMDIDQVLENNDRNSDDIPDPPDLNEAIEKLSADEFKQEILFFMLKLYGDENISRKRAQEIIGAYRSLWLKLLTNLKRNLCGLDPAREVGTFIDKMILFFDKSGITASEY
jgi:hypothetical protein